MMLDSDLCLAFRTPGNHPRQFLAKESPACCVWTDPKLLFMEGEEGKFCGTTFKNTMS
jgi:hypothetical protein